MLDYLIIEGYCDAAVEFAKEAGIDISVDYQSIEERMLIRNAVEAGLVDEAVRRVNELEPEVSIACPISVSRLASEKKTRGRPQRLQCFMHHSYAHKAMVNTKLIITDLI